MLIFSERPVEALTESRQHSASRRAGMAQVLLYTFWRIALVGLRIPRNTRSCPVHGATKIPGGLLRVFQANQPR